MDGVGTPIIGRPRPLPGHDTPNPANNTYTLNYEEPNIEDGSAPTIETFADHKKTLSNTTKVNTRVNYPFG